MGYGRYRAFSMTMGATSGSASVDLGGAFTHVYLQVPTMASAANLDLFVKATSGESFYQVFHTVPTTTSVQSISFVIGSTGTTNGKVLPLPAGFQFYKVVADSVPTAALSFKVICGD
jgi:hypothetical protein